MERKTSFGTIMNRICWWMVELASRMLDEGERDVVRGDLAECEARCGEALRDVVGLAIRRQAELWSHWRTSLIFIGLIFLLGMLLSVASRETAGLGATYTWLYANNWDFALLRNRGFWYVFADSAEFLTVTYLTLVCWSWSAGFVLGSITRKARVRSNAALFCLMLLFGVLVGAPRYLAFFWEYVHRTFPVARLPYSHDPISPRIFYRLMFPLIVQTILVAAPALWGMREGTRLQRFRLSLRTILWVAAIASLFALALREPGLGFVLKAYRHPEIWRSGPVTLLSIAVYWPVVYLLATAAARQVHRARMALS